MELFQDTNFWVLISFAIFVGFAFKAMRDGLLGKIDGRIEEIKKEIDTAESLRVEAQGLMAQYQRKLRDAQKEAEEIVQSAKAHAAEIKKEAEKDLDEAAKRREEQLQARLKRMEDNAVQEIKAHAAQLAVEATKEIIIKNMDKATNDRLVDQSIKDVSQAL